MKVLAIILMWVMTMFDHQFKRPLMVPHYDADGEEVKVESYYDLEWMLLAPPTNLAPNNGFENDTAGIIDNWAAVAPFSDAEANSDNQRSGSQCAMVKQNAIAGDIISDWIPIPAQTFEYGIVAWFWVKAADATHDTNNAIIIELRGSDPAYSKQIISDYHIEPAASSTTYYKVGIYVPPSEIDHDKVDEMTIQLFSSIGLTRDVFYDDVYCALFNPSTISYHKIPVFNLLNVEDYETFTFGQNYDIDESGGIPLAGSSRGSDDPVEYMRLADASAERAKQRDPIDIYNLTFLLFSKAQQTQLMHWYKRTRGLSFIWSDEYGVERDVQWVMAPRISPRSTNPEIATATIVLETTDSGER